MAFEAIVDKERTDLKLCQKVKPLPIPILGVFPGFEFEELVKLNPRSYGTCVVFGAVN